MLQTTGDNNLSTQAYENKKNHDAVSGAGRDGGDKVGRDIKNLSTIVRLAKSEKSNLAISKKSNLAKSKNQI